MNRDEQIEVELIRVRRGGAERHHQENREQGKLIAREVQRVVISRDLLTRGVLV